MSDPRHLSGNLAILPDLNGHGNREYATPHPLVEEAIAITLADLERVFGRKELLRAAEDATPVRIQIDGNPFFIYLLRESHRLPRRTQGVSDREVTRLWLVCMECRKKARKLYTYSKFPGSSTLVFEKCRSCHGLVYQSQNCGGNRWWREIAKPLKRLLRRRDQLLAKNQTPEVKAAVELLDQSIMLLRQKAAPKKPPKGSDGEMDLRARLRLKRPYRDLSPIIQSQPC